MNTKELVLKYWRSWQDHSSWETTRSLMKDDFKFDAGDLITHSADDLIRLMKRGNPWKDIELIECVVDDNKGALLYEGTDSETSVRFRIAEIITVEEDKVSACIANISRLPDSE